MRRNPLLRHWRKALPLALFLCALPLSFAAGAKESDSRKADGSSNWGYVYDISSLAPGKYNLLIEGKDKAGNVATQGPYNVWVDPKSDLPVVSISNPTPGLRVGGSLNIVGTCSDDDGVARVEVQLDQGEFRAAEGTEFWSLLLEDASLADGPHTVTARGVDVNGVTGDPVSVLFHLDTARPLIRMTSHESGVLVSGAVRLEGVVEDANGVRSLGCSTDGGASFSGLALRPGDDGKSGKFDLAVDTRRLPDGPHVYWFEGLDRTGSTGRFAFLFFVDNTGPVLQVLSPLPGQKVNGKVLVSGKITERVGIKSFGFETADGKSGTIELIPGDPYWVHEFDFTSVKSPSTRVSFAVVDLAGNRTVTQAEIALDSQADLPALTLLSPSQGASLSGDAVLSGFARDDDGVKAVEYSVDGKDAASLECTGAFTAVIPGLPAGRHKLAVRAVDVNGTAGKQSLVEFTSAGAPPRVTVETVETRAGSTPFRPGSEIDRTAGAGLGGKIVSSGRIKDAEYSFNGAPAQKLADMKARTGGEIGFQIRVPATIGFGVATLSVRVSDESGQVSEWNGVFRVTNTARRIGDPGIYFADARIQADGTALVSEEAPLSGIFAGEEAASVSLEPATDVVSVSSEGDRIIVTPRSAGSSGPVRIAVTTRRGHVFRSPEMRFVTDRGAPRSSLVRPSAITQGAESVAYYPGMTAAIGASSTLTGTIAAGSIKSATYTVQGGQPRPLPFRKGEKADETAFSAPLPPDLPFGRIEVRIQFTDAQGRTVDHLAWFWRVEKDAGEAKDAEGIYLMDPRVNPAEGLLLAPGEGVSGFFNGRPIAELRIDPATPVLEAVFEGNAFTLKAVSEGLPGPVRLRLKTVDGDTFESSPYTIRADAAAPAVTAEAPAAGSWVGRRVSLKGRITDANGIRAAEWAIGDAAPVPLTLKEAAGAAAFDTELDLSDLPDGPVMLSVRAQDAAGRTGVLRLALAKDTAAPEVSFLTPLPEDPVNGLVTVAGAAADAGVVDRVEFSPDGAAWTPIGSGGSFSMALDLSRYSPLPEKFLFRATDKGGNAAVVSPQLNVQLATDKPEVQIQVPRDGEVVRSDFTISGMAFDDDGVGAVLYRIDGGDFLKLPPANSFSIPLRLAEISDNEHVIEVKAQDLHGVESDLARSTFKVSKAEPVSRLLAPALTATVRGAVTLAGESSDKNGITEVFISADNGQTFDRAQGKESWSYRLDTRLLKDGTHSLFVKAVDGYGTEGLFATLVNVDNRLPDVILDSPLDGATVAGSLTLDGRAWDNIQLTSLGVSATPMGIAARPAGAPLLKTDLPLKGAFTQPLDLSSLAPGWYDLVVEARDKAENTTTVSRTLLVQAPQTVEKADILFPVQGEVASGPLTVAGSLTLTEPATEVELLVDGTASGSVPVDANGCFSTVLVDLPEGAHTFEVQARLSGDRVVRSAPRVVEYRKTGPWVRIASHPLGSFINARPFLSGEAGYALEEPDASDAEAAKRHEQEKRAHRVERVEVSLDNGKSFLPAQGGEQWRYRIETQNYSDGEMRLMVRAVFSDGSRASAKTILTVDDTPPAVALLTPREEGRYNGAVVMAGTARDQSGIAEVRVALRTGDKAAYEVPSFIQGLYFEGHALGASVWEVGTGLTFFDNNVKLQAQVGMLPADSRFSGLALGAKLLANVARLPFSFFLGPDWDLLSLSVALGADFSYVTNSGSVIEFTDKGLILGGVLGQIEFPIVRIAQWRMFNTYSIISEYQLWFISSDINAGIVQRLAFGVRVGLF